MTDCVVLGGVTSRLGYVVQLVASPVGTSVPSTMADAEPPGARFT